MEKLQSLSERFEILEFRPPVHQWSKIQIQTKDSIGLEVVSITRFKLNLVDSNNILFKIALLLFSRMSHLNDVKRLSNPK